MDYRRLIPNMCTSSNLVFGMCSILSTYSGNLVWGSIFILLALVADGLDGRTARFFGVASEMGKEMDSLCDLGSFGIAPAFLAWAFVLHNHGFLGVVVAPRPRSTGTAQLPHLAETRPPPVPRHPLARPRIALSGSRCRSVLDVRDPGHRQFSAGKFCKERLIVFVHTSF